MREPIGSAAYYTAVYNGASYVHARAYWLCCVLYGGTLSTCASLLAQTNKQTNRQTNKQTNKQS